MFCYKSLILSLAFCYSFSLPSPAQDDSTLFRSPDSTSFSFIHTDIKNIFTDTLIHPFDKSISFWFYNYARSSQLAVSNGNSGSYQIPFNKTSFLSQNFFHQLPFYDHLLMSPENIITQKSQYSASNVFYASGLKKEQFFNFFHTQQIDTSLFLSLHYNLISAPGIYASQRTNQNHFYASMIFLPQSERYMTTAGIVTNKIQQRENGGLAIPSEFEDSLIFSREYANVNYITAERKYNDATYFLKQYFRVFRKNQHFPLIIGHSANYNRMKNVYYDADPLHTLYPDILIDSTVTLDSVYIQLLTNSFTLSNYFPGDSSTPVFRYYAEFRYQNALFRQLSDTIPYFRKSLHGGVILQLPHSLLFCGNASFYKGEYSNGNLSVDFQLLRSLRNGFVHRAGLVVKNELLDPLFVYQYLNSNHYFWDNDFGAQRQLTVSAWADAKYFRANFSYVSLKDFVYIGILNQPEVYSRSFGLVHSDVTAVFRPGKFFIETTVGVNSLPDSVPVRLPAFYGQIRTGIEFQMFKGALKAFIGVEAFYFTEFYADLWHLPAALFMNQDQVLIGNYIYPSAFAGINIKRARIFAMLDNATAGLLDMNYYAMPYYPRFDRFFRWGISWTFYN